MGVLKQFFTNFTEKQPHAAKKAAFRKRKRRLGKRRKFRDMTALDKPEVVQHERQPQEAAAPRPRDLRSQSQPIAEFVREREAFARVRHDLLVQSYGKFVAFVGDEMVGPYDSLTAAVREAYQKYGYRPIYTKRIVDDNSVR